MKARQLIEAEFDPKAELLRLPRREMMPSEVRLYLMGYVPFGRSLVSGPWRKTYVLQRPQFELRLHTVNPVNYDGCQYSATVLRKVGEDMHNVDSGILLFDVDDVERWTTRRLDVEREWAARHPVGEALEPGQAKQMLLNAPYMHPLQELTAKDVRGWLREIGFRTRSLYRRKDGSFGGLAVLANPEGVRAPEGDLRTDPTAVANFLRFRLEQKVAETFQPAIAAEIYCNAWAYEGYLDFVIERRDQWAGWRPGRPAPVPPLKGRVGPGQPA